MSWHVVPQFLRAKTLSVNLMDNGVLNDVSPDSYHIQDSEATITFFWDFDCLTKAEVFRMPLQLEIQSDGIVASLYTQFATTDALSPNAHKLLLEMDFSDEGQLVYPQGFTHPIRNIELPPDLAAKFPPAEAYPNVYFPKEFSKLTKTAANIADGWENIARYAF